MAACRRITFFTKKGHFYLYKSASSFSTNPSVKESGGEKEIVVPYRIERGPTDILNALASTISKDHTAAHYKYEDDPYFMPASNITKRSFALSKESGRKAARYFLEKYPELFKCNKSEPHVKAFDPPVTYSEEDEVNEKTLKECIVNNDVKNCIDVFNILTKKGIPVSQAVKQDLLDILCFYNSTPPPSEDYYEERFYMRSEDAPNQKWNSKGIAEKIFENMEKDGKAYSAMIAGLAKFGEAEKALLLHDEMKSKGLAGTVNAYNCLISELHLIYEDSAMYWELAERLSHHMNSDGIKPNLYTMNALLRILSKGTRWRKSKILSLSILAEMKRLKIEPSLGTYYYLLMIYGNDGTDASIMYEIMNNIELKEHEVQHPTDVLFFATAMEMCWKSLNDVDLAYRLHNLLEYKRNCKLLGNSLAESHYFKCFFRLLCEKEDIDTFMELYDKYVPNTYTPEPIVTLSVIQAIHFVGAYKYLPRMCSDILLFVQSERTNILEALLEATACTKNEDEIQNPLVEMVWNIVDNLNERSKGRRLPFEWSGSMVGNILKTFMNGNDFEKSWKIIQKINEDEHLITGHPEKSHLLEFCQLCLDYKDYDKIKYTVKYAVNGPYPEFGEDVVDLTEKLIEENKLDESQREVIKSALDVAGTQSSDSDSDKESSSDSDSDSSSDDDVKLQT